MMKKRKIYDGMILLYDVDCKKFECNNAYPQVEIHETLHALGIDHITNRFSIMNLKIGSKIRKLDTEISECLEMIYGNKENYSCDDIPFFIIENGL